MQLEGEEFIEKRGGNLRIREKRADFYDKLYLLMTNSLYTSSDTKL